MRGVDEERKADSRHGNYVKSSVALRHGVGGKARDFVVDFPPSMTDEMDAPAAEKLERTNRPLTGGDHSRRGDRDQEKIPPG